jgi:hypothetical protein
MKEPYEPSPFEIRRCCFEIQATWTPEEERKRRGAEKTPHWNPPGSKRRLRIARPSLFDNIY